MISMFKNEQNMIQEQLFDLLFDSKYYIITASYNIDTRGDVELTVKLTKIITKGK